MRRVISAAATAAALTLAVAACGGDGGGTGTAPASSAAPAEIAGEITWWDTSDATTEAPAFKALVAEFHEKYPKINVNYVNVPFADARDKFKTAAPSGSGAPDVLRTDVGWVAEFASLGYLAPLDGTPAVDRPEEFLPTPAASGRFGGKTYGVPQVTDTIGLLYRDAGQCSGLQAGGEGPRGRAVKARACSNPQCQMCSPCSGSAASATGTGTMAATLRPRLVM